MTERAASDGEPEPGSPGDEASSDPAEAEEASGGVAVEGDSDSTAEEASGGPGGGSGGGSDDGDDSGGGDSSGGEGGPARGGVAWRDRRVIVPAAVAVVSLTIAVVLSLAGRSDDGGAGDDSRPLPSLPSTTMATGGLEVEAPEGWTAAPVPDMGFGIAVPPGWEAVVLSEGMLDSLGRSDPAVPGFVEAAHAAAESGAVFYAAGEDGEGRVSDLKVRAAPGTGITDLAALADYAEGLAGEPSLSDPTVEPVEGADRPTVRLRFQSTSESPDGDRITVEGVETVVVGPSDIVWSVIVISETPETVDDLAPRILDTLTFPPE